MSSLKSRGLALKLALLVLIPLAAYIILSQAILERHLKTVVTNDPQTGLSRSLTTLRLSLKQEKDDLALQATDLTQNIALRTNVVSFPHGSPRVKTMALELNKTVQAPIFILTNADGGVLYDNLGFPVPTRVPAPVRKPVPPPIKKNERSKDKKSKIASKKSVEPPPPPLYSIAQFPGVKQALTGTTVTGLFNIADHPFLAAAVPIRSGNRICGTLLLGFKWGNDDLAALKRTVQSDLVFLSGAKVLFSTFPASETLELATSSSAFSYRPVTLFGKTYLPDSASLEDLSGIPVGRLMVYQPVSRTVTVEGSPQKEILRWGYGLAVLLILLMTWMAHRLLRPFRQVLSALDRIQKGNLNLSLPVDRHDEWGVLSRSLTDLAESLKEKNRVSLILGKVVAPQSARKILAEKDYFALKGEFRECAVLHATLKGFDELSGNMEPAVLVETLNQYFSLIHEIVFRHEGMLDRFFGGNAVAVWGAPFSYEDKEKRAVETALEIQEAVGKLNQSRIQADRPPLTLGIGIHTGKVVAGNLGSDKRWDYSVIGDALLTAAKLSTQAAPGKINVTESTFQKSDGIAVGAPLNPVEVKGTSDLQPVFEISRVVK